MSQEIQQENKMGYMPIPKLLCQMSLPIVISMLIQALYNIVDSIFVAQINEAALTAVSLVFPVQNLMIAIAVGTGVGINALLSRSLGEKQFDYANRTALNGVFLAVLSSIIFSLCCLSLGNVFFNAQKISADIKEYGLQYMYIVGGVCFGVFMQITFERLLQSTGKTVFVMISQGSGAIINLILDPILIFGLLGFPKMGITGAAIATVTGQFGGMILSIIFNLKFNKELHFSFKEFRPDGRIIRNIYAVGLPSIIMQAISSVMTFGMNKILLPFTSTAAAVFGVYFKLNSFIFMPVFGLNNGMVPIIAYNYGARNKKRIIQTMRLSIAAAVCIMLIGLAVFMAFPDVLLGFFDASPEMLAIGVPALRIICLSFSFAGYGIVCGSVFQAMGNGVYSLTISIIRQLVAILPLAYIFSRLFGLYAVWWAFPLSEIIAVILSTFLLIRLYNQKIKSL